MNRRIKKLFYDWKIRKYIAIILVIIIALVGITISPKGKSNKPDASVAKNDDTTEDAVADTDRLYQYPVELGYPADYNYNGGPDIDYMKKIYKTESDGRNNDEGELEEDTSKSPSPDIRMIDGDYRKLHASFGDIYCTNSGDISFNISDTGNAGISKAIVMHADKLGYIVDGFNDAKYSVENNFYGKLTYNCIDNTGNPSALVSQYLLIENAVPNIQIFEGDIYDAPGTINVEVTDGGRIVSGIYEDSIECYINDKNIIPKDIKSVKDCRLADNLEVSTDITFSVEFPKDGNYDVQISVSDNCGNTAKFKYSVSVVNNKVIIS